MPGLLVIQIQIQAMCKVLLSNLYTVLKTEDDYYLKVVNNVCLTLLLKIHLGRHDADKNNLG